MADLGIARQTTAFYRTSTGACHQRARSITHTHLARRQPNAQAARATKDPECTPSPSQSTASPAAQDIGRKVRDARFRDLVLTSLARKEYNSRLCSLQEQISDSSAVSQQTVQESANSHRPLPAAAFYAALVSFFEPPCTFALAGMLQPTGSC